MSLVRFLCGPLSSQGAYWVDLLPDQANLHGSQGKVWVFFVTHLLVVLLPAVVVSAFALHSHLLEGRQWTEIGLILVSRMCPKFVGSGSMYLYMHSSCLVRCRHIVYFLHVFGLLIDPTISALIDPLVSWSLHLAICRALHPLLASFVVVFVFDKAAFGTIHWGLPGLLIFLIRWFLLSGVHDEGYPLAYSPLLSSLLFTVAAICVPSLWRCTRRSFKQVHPSTPSSAPTKTTGNVSHHSCMSVVPGGSSNVDESAALSHELAAASLDAWRADEGPVDCKVAIDDEDQLHGYETENEHVVEETETQGKPASESTQGEGESDGLHASSPAPALQDACGERDQYNPEQRCGAAPAVHSGGGPLGGCAAKQSARIVEPAEVPVHVVYGLTGETIADLKAVYVEDVQNAISRMIGVCPYQQKLAVEGRSYALWGTEVLAEVSADVRAQGDESLVMTINMIVDNEEHARGPFALGQDQSWGCWKGMSNSSGPLSGFDGRWKNNDMDEWEAVYHGHLQCWDELQITGTQVLDAFENPSEFIVRDGQVFTKGVNNEIARTWWMRDNYLCAIDWGSSHVQTYSRMTTRHPQRITTPTRMPYAEPDDRRTEPDDDDRRTDPDDDPWRTEPDRQTEADDDDRGTEPDDGPQRTGPDEDEGNTFVENYDDDKRQIGPDED